VTIFPETAPPAAPPRPPTQSEQWNGATGRKWRDLQPPLDRTLAPLGEALLAAAAPEPGERVLDIGCGCGDTTLALGAAVRAEGRVLGLDLSRPMLARAEERRKAAALAHVTFHEIDVETTPLPGAPADLVVSRFGVMFFEDEARAFRALAQALAPKGRAAFLVWAAPERNPWLTLALAAIAPLLPPAPPPPPNAPGPFRLAAPARIESLMAAGGFRDVAIKETSAMLRVGGGFDLAASTAFLLQLGPGAALLKDADEALKHRAHAAVEAALAPYATPAGVTLAAAGWLVTARAPC
jgi:SAM-dependent methyltransferase